MALSNDLKSYEDIRPYFERALATEKGIRLETRSRGQAIHLRQRLYKLRQLDRLRSTDLFEPGDERRGVSVYENVEVIIEDEVNVIIRPIEPVRIEEL